MTQQEFYTLTQYVQKENEIFDFWEMHEDYCNSPLSKEEYCQNWIDGYCFGLGAVGIKLTESGLLEKIAECERCITECETKVNPNFPEEWDDWRIAADYIKLYKEELLHNHGKTA